VSGVAPGLRIVAVAAASVGLAACEPTFRDMYDQPKQKSATGSPLFADGLATRAPAPDSMPIALGEAAANTSGRGGRSELARLDAADARQELPATVDAATLARGRERFTIYCAPCHGGSGTGDGPVVRRGFPAPPSYLEARLRAADDRHFFDVMTNGYGVMYSYRGRVDAGDRWAIVAWIRELQRSHAAPPSATTSAEARRR
jgi:mono/diheme cytochrome c family protein